MSVRAPDTAVPNAPAWRTTFPTSALLILVLARKAIDVRAGATDPLALDDGRSPAGLGQVPRQQLPALPAAQHQNLHPLRLRHDRLLAQVVRARLPGRPELRPGDFARRQTREGASPWPGLRMVVVRDRRPGGPGPGNSSHLSLLALLSPAPVLPPPPAGLAMATSPPPQERGRAMLDCKRRARGRFAALCPPPLLRGRARDRGERRRGWGPTRTARHPMLRQMGYGMR